ncbi:MAG: hypothetical protein LDL41_15590 [Coleofasciculus sp. S288]|nr:hypothetical protein [Coleofasciculus sp. S288]
MKKQNSKFLLRLLQSISSILMKEVDPDFLLELLQISSAVISLVLVSPTVGLIAGGVAVYCLLDKSKDDDRKQQ